VGADFLGASDVDAVFAVVVTSFGMVAGGRSEMGGSAEDSGAGTALERMGALGSVS